MFGNLLNEHRIFAGPGADAVIEVGDDEREVHLVHGSAKKMKKDNAVNAAGDGNDETVSVTQVGGFPKRLPNSLHEHAPIVAGRIESCNEGDGWLGCGR